MELAENNRSLQFKYRHMALPKIQMPPQGIISFFVKTCAPVKEEVRPEKTRDKKLGRTGHNLNKYWKNGHEKKKKMYLVLAEKDLKLKICS